MLQIILCFPMGYFIYRHFLQITFFQTLHILSVFIILGIGADNIFVFVDAWNQADFDKNPEVKEEGRRETDMLEKEVSATQYQHEPTNFRGDCHGRKTN